MLEYAKNLSLPKRLFPGSSKAPATAEGQSQPNTTAGPSSAEAPAPRGNPMPPHEPQPPPPSVITDIPPRQSTENLSPVLSHQDETFLSTALESATNELAIVIFEGSSTPSSQIASTPPSKAPSVKAETSEDPDPVEEQKHQDEVKKAEWKESVMSKWEGLRATVSNATVRKRSKSQAKSEGEKQEEKEETEEKNTKKQKKEEKEKEKEKKKDKGKGKAVAVPEREEDEFTAALERMNLATEDGTAFSFSAETAALLNKFLQILKDVINGVPTAYDDLITLFESSSKQLDETYDNLPSFLQKLVKAIPEKLTKNMSPELLRAAATTAPAVVAEGSKGGILQGIPSLKDLITKPGILMGLLKSVLNVLKTRFPAVLGVNVLYSMGLFTVLLVLYYCYKRGKEVRLEQEALQRAAGESSEAAEQTAREQAGIEELKDEFGEAEGSKKLQEEPLIVYPAKDKVA